MAKYLIRFGALGYLLVLLIDGDPYLFVLAAFAAGLYVVEHAYANAPLGIGDLPFSRP